MHHAHHSPTGHTGSHEGIEQRHDSPSLVQQKAPGRRAVVKSLAWSAPVIAAAVAAPAVAASPEGTISYFVDNANDQIVGTSTMSEPYTATFHTAMYLYAFPRDSTPYSVNGVLGRAAVAAGRVFGQHALGSHTVPAGGQIRFPIAVEAQNVEDINLTAGEYTAWDRIVLTVNGPYGTGEGVQHESDQAIRLNVYSTTPFDADHETNQAQIPAYVGPYGS
jgi:hypothetical protein